MMRSRSKRWAANQVFSSVWVASLAVFQSKPMPKVQELIFDTSGLINSPDSSNPCTRQ